MKRKYFLELPLGTSFSTANDVIVCVCVYVSWLVVASHNPKPIQMANDWQYHVYRQWKVRSTQQLRKDKEIKRNSTALASIVSLHLFVVIVAFVHE